MKKGLLLFVIFILSVSVRSQVVKILAEGTVTYISSENVYVKFISTDGIHRGDTLFQMKGELLFPVLLVSDLSSTSCVCKSISSYKAVISDKISAKIEVPKNEEITPVNESKKQTLTETVPDKNTRTEDQNAAGFLKRSTVHGKVSAASFSGFNNIPAENTYRMRYTVAINATDIGKSKVSAETYLSFSHRNNSWEPDKPNSLKGLQVYNLSVNYPLTKTSRLWLGRKINPRISNIGAIDGIQYEINTGTFTAGIITGFRPDLYDYGFNSKLLQYGIYIGHDYSKSGKYIQSTFSVVEQQNSGKTDRRFIYLQHTHSILKHLTLFGSIETDLYRLKADTLNQEINLTTDIKPRLTNAYLSLRYRNGRKISASFSYSSMNTVIYYESFKNYIDRLMESNTFQGYQAQFNYFFWKKLNLGISASYRFQKNDPEVNGTSYGKPSKSMYVYITHQQIPGLKLAATLSANILETVYLSGKIYSLGVSRDILKGRIFAGLTYRLADYRYFFNENKQRHHIGEFDLTWRMTKKYTLSFYAESTFQDTHQVHHLYLCLHKAF